MWSKAKQVCGRLPEPLYVPPERFDNFMELYYKELEDAILRKDYNRVFDISTATSTVQPFHVTRPNPEMAKRLVVLLYNFATTDPIVHYQAQIGACAIIVLIFDGHPWREIEGLELPWRPFYKFLKALFFGDPILRGLEMFPGFVPYVATFLSHCYSKDAADEMLELLLPKISPGGGNTLDSLTILAYMLPGKCNYHGWFENLFKAEMENICALEKPVPLFRLAAKIVRTNLGDDFSFLVPHAISAFDRILVCDMSPSQFGVIRRRRFTIDTNNVVVLTEQASVLLFHLFISPPTRKEILSRLELCMKTAKLLYHPSVGDESPVMIEDFIDTFLYGARCFIKDPTRYTRNSGFPKEQLPTRAELQQLFKPIVDCYISLLPRCKERESVLRNIRALVQIDPVNLGRFFEFAFESIVLTDAHGVAQTAWNIMTALFPDLPNSDLLVENCEKIFDMAVNNYYIVELQTTLTRFFYVFFSVCPFDPAKVPEKLKGLDFVRMSSRWLSEAIELARSFPALQDRFATINADLLESSRKMFYAFYAGASAQVIESLLPIIKTIVMDHSYTHANSYMSTIFTIYIVVCDKKSRFELKQIIRDQLDTTKEIVPIMFYVIRYTKLCLFCAENVDALREDLNYIKTFTTHPVKKVRARTWQALANCFYNYIQPLIFVEPIGPEMRKIEDFKITLKQFPVDPRPIVAEFFEKPLEILLKSTDMTEIYNTLSETGRALWQIAENIVNVPEGDMSSLNVLYRESPFFNPKFVGNVPEIKQKFTQAVLRLLNDFPEKDFVLRKIVPMCRFAFIAGTQDVSDSTDFLDALWGYTRSDGTYNCFEFVNRVLSVNEVRWWGAGVPVSPELKSICEHLCQIVIGRYKQPRENAADIIHAFQCYYSQVFCEILHKELDNLQKIDMDELFFFLSARGVTSLVVLEETLACAYLERTCECAMSIEAYDSATQKRIHTFLDAVAGQHFPYGAPQERNPRWESLVNNVLKKVSDSTKGVSGDFAAVRAIVASLKYVSIPSKEAVAYLLEQVRSSNEALRDCAEMALWSVLYRMRSGTVFEPVVPYTINETAVLFDGTFTDMMKSFTSLDDICEYTQGGRCDSKWPANVRALDSEAQGWYRFGKTTTTTKYNQMFEDLFLSEVSSILEESLVSVNGLGRECWREMMSMLGKKLFVAVEPALRLFFEQELTKASMKTISEFLNGAVMTLPRLTEADAEYVIRQAVLPIHIRLSQNPQRAHNGRLALAVAMVSVSPIRLKTFFDFFYCNITGDPDLSLERRKLFASFCFFVACRQTAFYSSVELLAERYVKPFFDDISKYHSSYRGDCITLYAALVEATCVPPYSPLYSQESEKKREYLLSFTDNFLTKYKDSASDEIFQRVLCELMYTVSECVSFAKNVFIPLLIKHIDVIFDALNSASISDEDILEEAMSTFITMKFFADRIDMGLQLIKAFIDAFDILSIPMQMKMLFQLREMVSITISACTKADLDELYNMFFGLTTNPKSDEVLTAIVNILGVICLYNEPAEVKGGIQAAAIISEALLFDEMNPLVIQAFDIIAEKIDSGPRSSRKFYEHIVEDFWRTNSEHMMPRVEEALIPYRMLVSPDYCA